jgi:hypothetical protein
MTHHIGIADMSEVTDDTIAKRRAAGAARQQKFLDRLKRSAAIVELLGRELANQPGQPTAAGGYPVEISLDLARRVLTEAGYIGSDGQ